MPPLIFTAVFGSGTYFALTEYGTGEHRKTGALIIAMAASSILATVAFIWTAFKVNLFKRRF